MQTPIAMDQLRETATPARAGELAALRLADAHAMLATDMATVDESLRKAVRDGLTPATDSAAHLLEGGGKRIRPLALLLSSACFAKTSDVVRELAVVAELVHLATLLHDDVVDDGHERRGRVTSRVLWGNAVSVLAGDLLLTHALERTRAVASGAVLEELLSTLRRLVDGEIVQLRGRTRLDVQRATYLQIVRDKTASLFVWASRAGATVAGAKPREIEALGAFGEHVGLAFQLVDDTLDYAGDPRSTGKALHADLGEGKITLPLIIALERDPGLLPLLQAAREGDARGMERLAEGVRETDACEAVRGLAAEETHLALQALGALPPSRARDFLACIAREMSGRAA